MNHHRTDLVALIFGMSFAIVGGCFVISELTDSSFDAGWALAIGLIAIGVVALLVTLLRPKPELAPSSEGDKE